MSEFEKKITEYKGKIKLSTNIEEIESLRLDLFGKNGVINLEFKKLGQLSAEEKKIFAANINKIKQDLLDIYNAKSVEILDKDIIQKVEKEKIDITLPEKEFNTSCFSDGVHFTLEGMKKMAKITSQFIFDNQNYFFN